MGLGPSLTEEKSGSLCSRDVSGKTGDPGCVLPAAIRARGLEHGPRTGPSALSPAPPRAAAPTSTPSRGGTARRSAAGTRAREDSAARRAPARTRPALRACPPGPSPRGSPGLPWRLRLWAPSPGRRDAGTRLESRRAAEEARNNAPAPGPATSGCSPRPSQLNGSRKPQLYGSSLFPGEAPSG